MKQHILVIALALLALCACTKREALVQEASDAQRIPVIFDTDANNELDDQHAEAYLLLNPEVFDVKAVTVNATPSGGAVALHYDEAKRIITLCNVDSTPLYTGADGSFADILPTLNTPDYDGHQAVEAIIRIITESPDTITLIAVGKLTNVALALARDSSIINNVRLVWLGSNYPEPGEYNQNNDTVAMNYLLNSDIHFEMVTVRYGKPSGTDAVKITQEEINRRMPGMGPRIETPIAGRNGGTFNTFGDYSIDLFKHIDYYGDPPTRALFDLGAVAIVKEPSWAMRREIPAPVLINNEWVDRPNNQRRIYLWENFDREGIIEDLFNVLKGTQH